MTAWPRATNMANEKVDMADLLQKILISYKQTHVSVNGQQAQIEFSILRHELKKEQDDVATKSEAQKLMLQSKVNAKKPGESSIVNFFTKQSSAKKDELI